MPPRPALSATELDRVADEIVEDLAEARRVGANARRHIGRDEHRQVHVASHGRRPDRLAHAIDQVLDDGVVDLEFETPSLDLGKIEDVVDESEQRARRGADDPHGVGLARWEVTLGEHLGHADHAIERSPDLVAHHREEGGLGAVGLVGVILGVPEGALDLLAGGQIGERAHRTHRAAGVIVRDGLALGQHPSVRAVTHAHAALELGADSAAEARARGLGHVGDIVAVDEGGPDLGALAESPRLEPEHSVELGAVGDDVRMEVPIPDPLGRRLHGEGEALVAGQHLVVGRGERDIGAAALDDAHDVVPDELEFLHIEAVIVGGLVADAKDHPHEVAVQDRYGDLSS